MLTAEGIDMSWDVYAIRAPGRVQRLEDLSDTHRPALLGQADSVIETIREAAPQVDASDPSWLVLSGPDHRVEISLGKGAQVHSLTFYITGGASAVPVVLDLCRRLAVTPFDTESGDVLTASSQPPAGPPPDDDDGGKRHWWQRGGGN